MIEGLQQQAKRLLGVNAEYKRQAIRYSNQLEKWEAMECQCKSEIQTDLEVENGELRSFDTYLGRVD